MEGRFSNVGVCGKMHYCDRLIAFEYFTHAVRIADVTYL
jgi:hypothetical protein